MGRTIKNRNVPRPKPVEKVELPSRHMKRRLLAAVLFLIVGAGAIAYGVSRLFAADTGWMEIEAESTQPSVAGDFVLLYDIGRSGMDAKAELRALTALYTQAAEKAWALLSDTEVEGVNNVYALNAHPNETLTLDAAFYAALERIAASDDRTLYLAPVAEVYNGLFSCADDALTADFDPLLNDGLRAYFAEIAAFASDPESVCLELMDGNEARLRVSEAYLAFAEEQEIGGFLDFQWMRNAFAADLIAEELIAHNFVFGVLSSLDGFSRTLGADVGASLTLCDGRKTPVRQVATLRCTGEESVVYLRGYPLTAIDSRRFYVRRDGQIRTAYLDPADGLSRAAASDLVVYASGRSCAEVLLRALPLYVADTLDTAALTALADEGIHSVRLEGEEIVATDPALVVEKAADGEETSRP